MRLRNFRCVLASFAAVCACVLVGCGGSDNGSTGSTPASTAKPPPRAGTGPVASTPSAPPPPRDATGPAKPPGESGTTGGPGDEEPIRVPADLRLARGKFTPSTVSVPAFLAIGLSVASRDGREHTVTVTAGRAYKLRVPAGGTARATIPGQRPGSYPVVSDDGARALLITGNEPGP